MRFFLHTPGEFTLAVTIDGLPEDAVFWDKETREETRSVLEYTFAILLNKPIYVSFESDPKEIELWPVSDTEAMDRAAGDDLMYDHEEGMETRG